MEFSEKTKVGVLSMMQDAEQGIIKKIKENLLTIKSAKRELDHEFNGTGIFAPSQNTKKSEFYVKFEKEPIEYAIQTAEEKIDAEQWIEAMKAIAVGEHLVFCAKHEEKNKTQDQQEQTEQSPERN